MDASHFAATWGPRALTSFRVAYLLDAYNLQTRHRIGKGAGGTEDVIRSVCFSPCGSFLYTGTADGRVHVLAVQTGIVVASLGGKHTDPIHSIGFNPKYLMLASATSVAMWIPTL